MNAHLDVKRSAQRIHWRRSAAALKRQQNKAEKRKPKFYLERTHFKVQMSRRLRGLKREN